MQFFSVTLAAVLGIAAAHPVFAQTPPVATREAVIARQQQEKAQEAAPYQPSRLEALFQRFEQRGFPFQGTPPGFYPALGSVYPGGGLAAGPGYRKFTGQRAFLDLHGLYSIKTYKLAEATFRSPGHARGRLDLTSRVGWVDAPRVDYYGLGSDTEAQEGAIFRLRQTYADSGLSWQPKRWLQLGVSGGYEAYDQGSGTGGQASIEDRYTAATAPRFGEDPSFARVSTTASLLWLTSPAYTRQGGFVRWTHEGRARLDRDGSFGVTRTEVVQHIPILRETWVLSLRGRAEAIVGDQAEAPFFLLPSLGGGHTLRAYSTGRFRDRKSLLLSGEWRWIPSRLALDFALFVDSGKVGSTWDDVTSGAFKTDYGIGARIHAPAATVLRIDLARGDDGMRLVIATSAPF